MTTALLALGSAGSSGQAHAQQAQPDPQKLLQKADSIAGKVAELRGLKQKRPIKRGVMQKDEIRKRLVQRIDEEYSAKEIAAEELALKRLGLLPESIDYKQLVIEMLTDQIAGFYDPAERRLYIAGWQQGGFGAMGDDMIMAHEIDHALQDQHFDLRAFIKPVKKNGDASVARQALVEGDGTALMVEYMLNDMGVQMAPWQNSAVLDMMGPQMTSAMATGKLAEAPLILRESLVFPYLGGLGFVAHFRKLHPWSRIDAIYKKPPLSTEHILHPEKYELYERPVQLTAAALPALKGYRMIYDNVNGELGLRLFLQQHLIENAGAKGTGTAGKPANSDALREKADRAAAGWGGDRVAVYTPPGHTKGVAGTVGISYSVWDADADALEAFEAMTDALPSLSGGGQEIKADDTYAEYHDRAGAVYLVQRKGTAVIVVLGASKDSAPAILEQVGKLWRVQRK